MVLRLAIVVIIFLATTNCTDSPISTEPFAGQWIVTKVLYDGTIKPEWVGVPFIIEQTGISGGRYSMIETKYDSIWSKAGRWTKLKEPNQLIIDDTLRVDFSSDKAKLVMVKRLPWTSQLPCNGPKCIMVVTGYWNFEFTRVN